MNRWLLLAAAIVAEVCATVSLKGAQSHPWLYVVVGVGYVSAMLLITACLRSGMPLGVAYGTWAAAGVALTAIGSRALFGEALTRRMTVGIALIMVGVLLLELGGGH